MAIFMITTTILPTYILWFERISIRNYPTSLFFFSFSLISLALVFGPGIHIWSHDLFLSSFNFIWFPSYSPRPYTGWLPYRSWFFLIIDHVVSLEWTRNSHSVDNQFCLSSLNAVTLKSLPYKLFLCKLVFFFHFWGFIIWRLLLFLESLIVVYVNVIWYQSIYICYDYIKIRQILFM